MHRSSGSWYPKRVTLLKITYCEGRGKKHGFSGLNLTGSKHHTAAPSLPLLWDKGEKGKAKSEKTHKDTLIEKAKATHTNKGKEGN